MPVPDFATLAAAKQEPRLDELALALAREFRDANADFSLAELDRLGAELADAGVKGPLEEVEALRLLLGERHGFVGHRKEYDHPDNSMLDLVLERRTGLPILLSAVYVEVARRAGIPLAGVGLPGHFVVGHFGADPPILLDPFSGGRLIGAEVKTGQLRPWTPRETALRMLNNLVGSYAVRADLGRAIRAARLRLVLPADGESRAALAAEVRALEARLN